MPSLYWQIELLHCTVWDAERMGDTRAAVRALAEMDQLCEQYRELNGEYPEGLDGWYITTEGERE